MDLRTIGVPILSDERWFGPVPRPKKMPCRAGHTPRWRPFKCIQSQTRPGPGTAIGLPIKPDPPDHHPGLIGIYASPMECLGWRTSVRQLPATTCHQFWVESGPHSPRGVATMCHENIRCHGNLRECHHELFLQGFNSVTLPEFQMTVLCKQQVVFHFISRTGLQHGEEDLPKS